jgi:hypothetical protein
MARTFRIVRSPFVFGAVVITSCALILACADESFAPRPVSPDEPLFASSSSDIKVSSTRPDSGVRGTTLDVSVLGSGFEPGSVADWALNGERLPNQVRTNSTRYVSQRELVANITISSDATVASWDVVVTTTKGKTGIGTELFAVKLNGNVDTDSRALLTWDATVNVAASGEAVSMNPAGIRGDGRDRFGGANPLSEYQGRFCGVRAKIFWVNAGASRSGDLVFAPAADYTRKDRVCGSARTLAFYLGYEPGGDPGQAKFFGSSSNAKSVMTLAAVGDWRSQPMGFTIGMRGCERLQFDPRHGANVASVRVTRLADAGLSATGEPIRQWRVESEYPHNAMCVVWSAGSYVATGTTKYLPFAFTATEIPFPYPEYP